MTKKGVKKTKAMRTLHSYFSAKPSPAKKQQATPRKDTSDAARAKQESTPSSSGSRQLTGAERDRIAESKRLALDRLKQRREARQQEKGVDEPAGVSLSKFASPSPRAPASRERPSRKRKPVSYNEGGDDDMDVVDEADEAYAPPADDGESEEEYIADEEEADEESDDVQVRRPRKKRRKTGGAKTAARRRVVVPDEDSESDGGEEGDSPTATGQDFKSSIDVSVRDPRTIKLSSAKSRALARAQKTVAGGGGAVSEGAAPSAYKNWDFLDPKYRRDAEGRRPGEPGYDSNSIQISESYFKQMTPAEGQYWRMKKDNMDTIFFFKMGKFYELFDDDADVGARELQLNYMSGKRRHTGFPEAAFEKYGAQLVQRGFKVARVEQMETPAELKERNKALRRQGKKTVKVVRREMLQVLTPGTAFDEAFIGHKDANFTVAICEQGDAVGVCFVDTSRCKFFVGQFDDDHFRSRLRTLLAQLQPREIVIPRDTLSKRTQLVLRSDLRGKVGRNVLAPGAEFWDADATWANIDAEGYFSGENGAREMPDVLRAVRERGLAMAGSALGGLLYYLRRVLIDKEQLAVGEFRLYEATDARFAQNMVLDAQTLENLEILQNDQGGREGTLLAHVDHTATAFGRRLIKEWLMRPLVRAKDINARLDAVGELMARPDDARDIRQSLKSLPDLERLLTRVNANSVASDRGAVMYGDVNSKKVKQFLKILKGFGDAVEVLERGAVSSEPFESPALRRITRLSSAGGAFPDIRAELKRFDRAFDKAKAERAGFIVPAAGVNEDYDASLERVSQLQAKLDRFLRKARERFSDRSIKYKHLGNQKYQLEIPISTLKRKASELPSDWMLCGSSKKMRRYLAPKVKQYAEGLDRAEFERDAVLKDVSRQMFADFCRSHAEWNRAIACIAELDCLISLSVVSHEQTPSARPEPVEGVEVKNGGGGVLEVRGGVHPTVALAAQGPSSTFIPNDIVVGAAENKSRFLLVSGPNMGGKSTLLRQTCITLILAQLGCYVPAQRCRFSPVDRIFTRVGANDRIMQGQSTFMVELQETGTILKHATAKSLIILDELGRGTSTFDGTAIAYAVIRHLLQATGCMTLFSTHYHKLLDEFRGDDRVAMFHMACNVETNPVTFLYKFTRGVCKNSYGMNCASLAGLPATVVERAKAMASHFEDCLSIAHGQSSEGDSADFAHKVLSALKEGDGGQKLAAILREVAKNK